MSETCQRKSRFTISYKLIQCCKSGISFLYECLELKRHRLGHYKEKQYGNKTDTESEQFVENTCNILI